MKITNITGAAVSASLLFLLIACSTNPPKITLPDHPIDGRSDNMETSNMKIVLLSGKHRNVAKLLQNDFRDVVADVVNRSGSEVVNRDRASLLIDELNLSSLDSDNLAAYEGPDVADYVIIANLKRSANSSSYHKQITSTDKDGNTSTRPAYCTYRGNVKGTVDIRELPSLKRVDLINVEGSKTSYDSSYINRRCDKRDMKAAVTSSALEETFVKGTSEYNLLTDYIGAKAYITGAKKGKDEYYLETNLGRALGAEKGASVTIFEVIEGRLAKVAKAKFSENQDIYSDLAFLEIDQDDFFKIRKGMVVKISSECDFLDIGCQSERILKSIPSF